MRTIDIGLLVHQVTIQRRTKGVDASGAPLETWSDVCTAAMGKLTEGQVQKGGETYRADQLSAQVVTRWVMRHHEAMDPDAVDVCADRRLVYRGRVYDIVQAETMDRQQGIRLRTIAHSAVTA